MGHHTPVSSYFMKTYVLLHFERKRTSQLLSTFVQSYEPQVVKFDYDCAALTCQGVHGMT